MPDGTAFEPSAPAGELTDLVKHFRRIRAELDAFEGRIRAAKSQVEAVLAEVQAVRREMVGGGGGRP